MIYKLGHFVSKCFEAGFAILIGHGLQTIKNPVVNTHIQKMPGKVDNLKPKIIQRDKIIIGGTSPKRYDINSHSHVRECLLHFVLHNNLNRVIKNTVCLTQKATTVFYKRHNRVIMLQSYRKKLQIPSHKQVRNCKKLQEMRFLKEI